LVLKDGFGDFVYLFDDITTPVKEEPEGRGSGDGGEVVMELVVEVEPVGMGGLAVNNNHSEGSAWFWSSFETTTNGRFWERTLDSSNGFPKANL
jgi:hypothetical protein